MIDVEKSLNSLLAKRPDLEKKPDDADALGEDIAAKFLQSHDGKTGQFHKYEFEHYLSTYTRCEMDDRIASLKRTAEKIRSSYGIEVEEIDSTFLSYDLHLFNAH